MSGDRDLGSPGWRSFWDLATPEEAAALLREDYGAGAEAAAVRATAAALADGRVRDACFWVAVRAALCPRPPPRIPPAATSRH